MNWLRHELTISWSWIVCCANIMVWNPWFHMIQAWFYGTMQVQMAWVPCTPSVIERGEQALFYWLPTLWNYASTNVMHGHHTATFSQRENISCSCNEHITCEADFTRHRRISLQRSALPIAPLYKGREWGRMAFSSFAGLPKSLLFGKRRNNGMNDIFTLLLPPSFASQIPPPSLREPYKVSPRVEIREWNSWRHRRMWYAEREKKRQIGANTNTLR